MDGRPERPPGTDRTAPAGSRPVGKEGRAGTDAPGPDDMPVVLPDPAVEPVRQLEPTELRLHLTLTLPRDAISVPVVRHLCGYALREVGATGDCVSAIELAVTEACANVLHHSGPTDAYEVAVDLAERRCAITVVDHGPGFDDETISTEMVDVTAESGRGVNLMRALVDAVRFTVEPQTGAIVRLVKMLDFEPGTPAHRLLAW